MESRMFREEEVGFTHDRGCAADVVWSERTRAARQSTLLQKLCGLHCNREACSPSSRNIGRRTLLQPQTSCRGWVVISQRQFDDSTESGDDSDEDEVEPLSDVEMDINQ
jgi:hypothetical protein